MRTAAQFWARVRKSRGKGCFLWLGGRTGRGYGQAYWKGQKIAAHRVAWFLAYGLIPAELYVCHHCDTPLCVRPGHLFLGTSHANTLDAVSKGRMGAKLTWDQVESIRAAPRCYRVRARLAAQFGVSIRTISDIRAGQARQAAPPPRPKWAGHGVGHHRAKLTDTAVLEIRRLRAEGQTLKAIAARFDVTPATVCRAAKGQLWRAVAHPAPPTCAP